MIEAGPGVGVSCYNQPSPETKVSRMLLTSNPEPSQFTEEEKAAVNEQLDRLLASSYFSHSRRFPALLRFVVENTLAGCSDLLKERTLGVEVFGKSVHYDTANDPIVRVTAGEIRKRIALYYAEPGHVAELRLSLLPGSYVPHFEWPRAVEKETRTGLVSSPESRVDAAVAPELSVDVAERPFRRSDALDVSSERTAKHGVARRGRVMAAVAVLAVLVVISGIGLAFWRTSAGSPVRAFWAPLLNSPDSVLFCVADQTEYTNIQLRDAADPTHQSVLHDSLTAVVIDDLLPIVDIAGVLRQNGKSYTVRGEGATTLNDLRSGPAIFVGAYDNAWTLRLLQPLRFHFANNPEMNRFWIVDTASKKPSVWVVDRKEQIATNIYRDYAIVSRFTDSDTGRLSVVVAGIGRGGTIAAGEFLTTPALLKQIEELARASDKKNLEVVLSTQIIGGQPGTPRVEASYSW